MKRLLIVIHRYLGASLCVLFATWFASGIVMVFAGFPRLTEAQRLSRLPELKLNPDLPSPARALAAKAVSGRIALGLLGDRAVYRYLDSSGRAGLISGNDGSTLSRITPEKAAALAADFLGQTGAAWKGSILVERRDQWNTTSPRESQFPLWRFDAADRVGTEVYVSLVTGEVVQASNRRDRILAWLGAIPHWIYPIALRRHAEIWRPTVILLSGVGMVLCLSGIVLGLWHWRPLRRGRRFGLTARAASPYRDHWLRWHHYLGLCFGGLAFTWVGSGMLSLNPFRWSDGPGPTIEEEEALAGGPLRLNQFVLSPAAALEACKRAIKPRELELVQLVGRPYYLCRELPGVTRLVRADGREAEIERQVAASLALQSDAMLWRGRPIAEVTILENGDAYYYARHIDATKPTAILRVRLGDADGTWYYIDLRTAKIVRRLTSRGRLERWLYHGLHSLDFPRLYAHPTTWRVTIVGLCGFGCAFSVTGVAVSLGWLGRTARRRAASQPRRAMSTSATPATDTPPPARA